MAMANDAVAAAANDADVIASILSQLPIDHYDRVRSVSQLWNDGVRCKLQQRAHADVVGFHPGVVTDKHIWPTDVAVLPGGAIAMTEAWSHCVYFIDREGREKMKVGKAGRGPGEMIYPTGVHVDQGEFFVVDSGNHRIQKFATATGDFLGAVGSAGQGEGQFGNPKAVVTCGDQMYVSDGLHHRIAVFDRATMAWRRHVGGGRKGSGELEFHAPEGMAAWSGYDCASAKPSSTLLFVADSENHRVQVLDLPSCAFVRTIGSGEGSRPGQLSMPTSVAIDAHDRLLVAECRGCRVQVMTLAGEPLQIVWLRLGAPKQVVLRGISCATGSTGSSTGSDAFVCDFANHRVGMLRLIDP